MSVRETINKHPRITSTAASIFVVVALTFVILHNRASNANPRFTKSAFYTVDDGATYFADSFLKPYPFDHDGKPAYRACVFEVGSGQPFVAYLERYTDAGKTAVEPLLGSTDLADQIRYRTIRDTELEAKKPGGKKWFKAGTAGFAAVTQSILPPGVKGDATMLYP